MFARHCTCSTLSSTQHTHTGAFCYPEGATLVVRILKVLCCGTIGCRRWKWRLQSSPDVICMFAESCRNEKRAICQERIRNPPSVKISATTGG